MVLTCSIPFFTEVWRKTKGKNCIIQNFSWRPHTFSDTYSKNPLFSIDWVPWCQVISILILDLFSHSDNVSFNYCIIWINHVTVRVGKHGWIFSDWINLAHCLVQFGIQNWFWILMHAFFRTLFWMITVCLDFFCNVLPSILHILFFYLKSNINTPSREGTNKNPSFIIFQRKSDISDKLWAGPRWPGFLCFASY